VAALEAIKGVDLYDPVQVAEMCLVLNMVMSKKFRVPKFIKDTGSQCPITHLKSYYNKMTEATYNEKLLMRFFRIA
jgi:hypothetical protein